jgi:poly-gamma-glutamate synthesis protein (capsule biosynthesis protein)
LLWALGGILGCAPGLKNVQKADEPAAPPTATVTPAPQAFEPSGGRITLAFTGDIMMGGRAAHKLKTEGPDSFFTETTTLLKQADITMGNLEGPLGLEGKNTVKKKYTFLVDPSAALGLSHAGFKLLTLANNHSMDFGPVALDSTLKALEAQGLKHAGAGSDLKSAREPAWMEVRGRKIAVLAYSLTYPSEFWATASRPGCAPADGYLMKEDIQAARAKGADLVIVCCHWGQEKHTKLRGYQPQLAHLAIEAGADAVVGHHPHIWQGLEVYQGKPIVYSIGNFCFGTVTSIGQSGILYLTFNEKKEWVYGKIVPLNVNNHQVAFTPKPMGGRDSVKFFLYLKKLSKKMDLRLLQGDVSEIYWNPPVDKSPAPRSEGATAPTPTATPQPDPLPTPTFDPAGNPQGSVPGLDGPTKPRK